MATEPSPRAHPNFDHAVANSQNRICSRRMCRAQDVFVRIRLHPYDCRKSQNWTKAGNYGSSSVDRDDSCLGICGHAQKDGSARAVASTSFHRVGRYPPYVLAVGRFQGKALSTGRHFPELRQRLGRIR